MNQGREEIEMHEPRLDLSPLDPRRDPQRWERLVGRVLSHAAPELERRAGAVGPLGWLARWAIPALPLAAALAAVALGGLAVADRAVATEPSGATVIEALAPPDPVYSWLAESRAPLAADLILAIEEEAP